MCNYISATTLLKNKMQIKIANFEFNIKKQLKKREIYNYTLFITQITLKLGNYM